ncbi:hypothetical protein [Streptomyces chartreusis]|uniref:hypothetical protein n=1 Tax=Streptomyces chartreusis TaxID=1969 RepID=UPI003811F4EE
MPILAAELSIAWTSIQAHHSDLPALSAPEALIDETTAICGDRLCFERLLHEAAHALALTRGIRDTSRAGRYHNRRFCTLAEEVGLCPVERHHGSSGFSRAILPPETQRRYASTMERLHRALQIHEHLCAQADEATLFSGPVTRCTSSGGGIRVKAVCGCGRNMRIVPSVLALAPITCNACGVPFRHPADT